MLKQKDLILLSRDDKVNHFLVVRKCEIRQTKAGKPYYFLTLGDKTTALNANVWDGFEGYSSIIKNGDIIRIRGVIDEYQGVLQIKVAGIETDISRYDVSHSDFLARSVRDPDEMKAEFFNRIDKISDTWLKALLLNIFNEENFGKFALAPAGKSWHHAYLGGLLEHTLEIIRICDLLSDLHLILNRDLLIAGAMLHDFGKTEELSYKATFDYTDKGKLLGHIVIAAIMVNEEASKIQDFPEELKNCLIHMVLSHQGKLEFASPVVPKTLEAITLYHADELSAKVNAYKNAVQAEAKSDSKWTKWLNLAATDLYMHEISGNSDEITGENQTGDKKNQTSLFDKGE